MKLRDSDIYKRFTEREKASMINGNKGKYVLLRDAEKGIVFGKIDHASNNFMKYLILGNPSDWPIILECKNLEEMKIFLDA